jgi:hypothetical protein
MEFRRVTALALAACLVACAGVRPLPSASGGSSSLYVASGGSDRNDGSSARPFRSISQCATTAKRGQTCYVAAGTYRETIRPNDGVTIRPAGTGVVTLLATDRVTGWKRSSGSVFVAKVALDPSLAANQVFAGSPLAMLPEAQWPLPSRDPLHPNWALEAAGSSENAIVDPTLPSMRLAGAVVNMWSGQDPWTHVTGRVTSSSGAHIDFVDDGDGCPWFCSMKGGFYYVTGARDLLRAPGEWWYDASAKRLYLWPPRGADLRKLDVEAKQRSVLIDLSGRSHVTIVGLHLFGGGLLTSGRSFGDTIDGVTALYPSNVLRGVEPYFTYDRYPSQSGLVLDGTGNTIENSTIAYSATNGVVVEGRSNAVVNTLIHDVDWIGDYSSGVLPLTGNMTIDHDTIYDTGRSAITFGQNPNVDVGYDNLYDGLLLSVDAGEVYACCMKQAIGTRVHHNWVHEETTPKGRLPHSNGCTCPWGGVYIDNGLGGITVDHNVLWRSWPGIFLHGQSGHPSRNVHIDDNTMTRHDEASIWLLNLSGFAGTEVSGNRIATPMQLDATSRGVPRTNNSPNAPGAGSIGRPGCSFTGC